ncbi:MAG: phosphoglycerate kinase [Candidatus Caldatribacteriota bacterium]|nr:phosphoglycerate kinase [Candidatus Caldatribacteriota bacterium]
MQIRSIRDIKKEELKEKKIIVRVDFNVPLNEKLEITNDTRIKASLPTIKYLISCQAKVILMSHLGRPKGKKVEKLRLDPVAKRLSKLLGQKVRKLEDCIGPEVEKEVSRMQNGDIVLLENLRFYPGEEKNDQNISKKLANLAEIYVNDAFGTAHRAHASTVGVAKILPSYAGFLMEKESEVLGELLENPKKPFVVLLGGAKVSGKIEVVKNLINVADTILISGGMSFNCLAAMGYKVGNSILEEYDLDIIRNMLKEAKEKGTKIILPVDLITVKKVSQDAEIKMVQVENISEDSIGVDIGKKSIALYKKELNKAKTIFWNGPVGIFEIDKFAKGTNQIARCLAEMKGRVVTVVGGGDSITALEKAGLASQITYLSTGGGASLKFLGGDKLPGIEVLLK